MKEQIKHYEATGKLLTHPHVLCSKCQGKTTMFGSNLEGRIKRFGSLLALLEGFECRSCRPKQNKPQSERAPRKNKGLSKQSKAAELIKDLPKMQFSERKPIVLVDNPEFAAKVTAHSCVRPDIFLDSQRSCDFCALYQVCKAPNRRLSSQGWQMGVAA